MLNIVKGAFGVVDGDQPEYEDTMVVEHRTMKKISRTEDIFVTCYDF